MPPLRGRVGAGVEVVRRRREAKHAGHVQDSTSTALLEKTADGGAIGQEGAGQVGVERRVPAVVAAFVQRDRRRGAGR